MEKTRAAAGKSSWIAPLCGRGELSLKDWIFIVGNIFQLLIHFFFFSGDV